MKDYGMVLIYTPDYGSFLMTVVRMSRDWLYQTRLKQSQGNHWMVVIGKRRGQH